MPPRLADRYAGIYGRDTLKLIAVACMAIVLSIIATGMMSYRIAEEAVISKLTSQDMVYVLKSISAQIDGRIQRAEETSLALADNPIILRWFEGGESDKQLEELAQEQIAAISAATRYSSIFLANPRTGHYWTDSRLLTDDLSKDDPADVWFFNALASGRKITPNIDHNKVLDRTMLWINTLMGGTNRPVGVAGVGLDIQDISQEFRSYKIGNNSSLWLVNSSGAISISEDPTQIGGQIADLLPRDVYVRIMKQPAGTDAGPTVLSYGGGSGQVDLIFQRVDSTDWTLVFQIDRAENLGVLNTIVFNTIASSLAVIAFVLLLFFVVSTRIANPYRQALKINAELEREVEERTSEIQEKNRTIVESIEYARAVQLSILPSPATMNRHFRDSFVIWKPRDMVGGDFYWCKQVGRGTLLVVADCTGHGVAGAFMTMAVNSILNNIVDSGTPISPIRLIRELDRRVKEAFNKERGDHSTDDGLDAAVCYYEGGDTLQFAAAKLNLYLVRSGQVQSFTGHRSGIGYIRSGFPDDLRDTTVQLEERDLLYITTDGYPDQNGGSRGFSFGKSRFRAALSSCASLPMDQQKRAIEDALQRYMSGVPQRDDITVVGLECGPLQPADSREGQ